MESISYRAKQVPSGIRGLLSFQAQELETELAEWLREQHRWAKKKQEQDPLYELEFEVTLRRWYKRRTIPANNLSWELATRLAAADHVDKELVHNAIREVYYPRVEYHGTFVPKPSREMSTVEMAKVIEAMVIECQTHDPPVEIRDIWVLFTQWRFGQEVDPLQGTYASEEDYREKHPCCEAHGKVLLYIDKEGVQRNAGEIAHIVSVGSGGPDADWNWLLLCADCHRGLQHAQGWDAFVRQFPHLAVKVERARARAGKAPVAARTGEALPAAPDPAAVAETVELTRRVFGGSVVQDDTPAPADADKQAMLDRLRGMGQQAEERQERYFGKGRAEAPPQEELPFDPKTAQYKED